MEQRDIYRDHAEDYDALVAAEDHQGNLRPALERILAPAGRRVIEVGAGTGRLTRLLLEAGAEVIATERSPAMLAVARRRLAAHEPRVRWYEADARTLPLADAAADAAVAGWVFGHLRHWLPQGWRAQIGQALAELRRVVVPGGPVLIIETLGTGATEPRPPNDALAEYYRWLEGVHGFTREAIRTDYRFASAAEAAERIGFFFGEAKARALAGQRVVPECTGLWWRREGPAADANDR